MNDHIQKRRQQLAKLREREEENKVDPKNEIGFLHLKGQYQISFRQPLYQGLVEVTFPILLQYLLSGYNNQWYYFQNLLFIYISYILKYFKCEYWAMKLPIRSIQTFYIGVTYFFYRNQVQLYHNLLMMFGMETFIEYIPGGLTFGELFNLSSLNSYYCCYFIDTLKKQHNSMYFVGKNTHNTLIFSPWAVFNLTWIIATLGSYVIKNKVINTIQSFVIAVSVVLGLIQQVQGLSHLMPFLEEIFFNNENLMIIVYMGVIMINGILLIIWLQKQDLVEKNTLRKSFHILALVMFFPGILTRCKLMVFAFNCVTVVLLYVELARYFIRDQVPFIKTHIDSFFKSRCDEREAKPNSLIITHILLLMGCALPITVQFVILGGGFQSKEFQLFGLAGLIYLGIGDVFASVLGKKYGLIKWKNNNSKTTQGTQYFVLSTFVAYLMIINMIYPRYLDIFMVILLSTILGGVCEGLTHQYDNLVCTVFFYYVLVTANNFFQAMI